MNRKFTTVLALDVVGFSKLMSLDEDRTLMNLQARRKIIDPLIEQKAAEFSTPPEIAYWRNSLIRLMLWNAASKSKTNQFQSTANQKKPIK